MASPERRERVLQSLLDRGAVSADALARARRAADQSADSVIATLSRLGLASEEAIADTISQTFFLPRVESNKLTTVSSTFGLSIAYMKQARLIPLDESNSEAVILAMADATDEEACKAVALFFDKPVSPLVALPTDIETALGRLDKDEANLVSGSHDNAAEGEVFLGGLSELDRLREAASDAPVIRFVNGLLSRAVDERASDVHLEPTPEGLTVRFRVDGRLRREPPPPMALRDAILSRIKLMAALDIAEHRLPQDGRISFAVRGEDVDFRVATTPTTYGESIVIRVLDRAQIRLDFTELGFDVVASDGIRKALASPNGMVLVTGPTGSGKTTTLYAALAALNSPDFKLMTAEDPIEYQLPGIQQVQINPAIGLSFARVLRSFLRHNPNIVMVGEIRDLETAQTAVQVALTGHLLLSTLHTNDAASGVTRLLDIGVEDYLVASTCNAIVAQRLVRTLCAHCKQPRRLSAQAVAKLGLPPIEEPLFEPKGCPKCNNTGFSGRTTIAEILHFTDAIRELVLAHATAPQIAEQARQDGMRMMFEHGVGKVRSGVTTIEEVLGAVRAT